MRSISSRLALLLAPLLLCSACGSSGSGQAFNPFPSASSKNTPTNPVASTSSTLFPNCTSPSIDSTDQTFAAAYASAQICVANSASSTVLFKVSSSVPANTEICLVPFVYNADLAPTCLIVNGSAQFLLPTSAFTSIVVLPQASLSTYDNYLTTLGAVAPSRMVFSF